MSTAVGVIGLGAMGMGVATSLRRAGFATHVCDVRDERIAEFIADGGVGCRNPAELATHCGIIVVLVVDATQLESVLFGADGAATKMARGGIVIVSVTIAPGIAEAIGARLAERGLRMIDAPVSGGAARAATGELTIMGSGDPEAFEAAADVLAAIAQKTYRLGPLVGQGSRVKMINQLLAGVHIAAAAEAMALGIKAGADPKELYEVISNSAGSSWMFQNRVPHILAGDYTPLSAVNIFIKDLGIVLDAARKMPFPLPLTAAAHQMFLAAGAAGHGFEDDSAVIKIFQALAGIELPGASD